MSQAGLAGSWSAVIYHTLRTPSQTLSYSPCNKGARQGAIWHGHVCRHHHGGDSSITLYPQNPSCLPPGWTLVHCWGAANPHLPQWELLCGLYVSCVWLMTTCVAGVMHNDTLAPLFISQIVDRITLGFLTWYHKAYYSWLQDMWEMKALGIV